MDMLKKVALCDIANIEKSQIFVLFENEASYEDFFGHKCFMSYYGYLVQHFQSKFDLKKNRATKVTFCYSCINMSL